MACRCVENFRNMCLKIYGLDPTYFVSAPRLAWQACLKKTGVKLELLTDYDMLLMVKKGIRGKICLSTHRYAKAKNKCIYIYISIFVNTSAVQKTKENIVHIRALKQVLNYGLKLKKVPRVIQFYQKAWLKPYIDMNAELRINAKNEFERISLS